MQKALKDEKTSAKLSKLICYLSSEWWVDSAFSYWQPIFMCSSAEQKKLLEEQLKNLCWWDEVATKSNDLPLAPNVYHFHPVAFVEQMRKVRMKIHDKQFDTTSILFLIHCGLIFSTGALAEVRILCQDSLCLEYRWLKNENTVECIVWEDKKGLFFLGIDQIETGKIAQADFSSKLTAYTYAFRSDSTKKELWRIRDFSPNVVTRISYLQNTLTVRDIDSDGIAETSFLYCISGDCCDPWTVKLMLHKNYEKLAIRGQVPIHDDDLDSYQKNVDPAFKKYDPKIRAYASEQWDKAIKRHWKDILGSSVEALFK